MKRFLSLLVVLAMVLAMAPAVFADEAEIVYLTENQSIVTNAGTVTYQAYGYGGNTLDVYGDGDFSVIYNGETIVADGGWVSVLTAAGNPRTPVEFQIVGDGEFTVVFTAPVGTMGNADHLVNGTNTAVIEAGNTQGYYYTWIASNDGTLTITVSAEPGWMYTVNNISAGTYGDTQWSDSDPVVDTWTGHVSSGNELQVIVSTYDANDPWNTPAGNVTVTVAFEPDPDPVYENVHTPVAGTSVPAGLTNVDITKEHTVVYDANGYGHLDTADGPVLYADMINDVISLADAVGAPRGLFAYINGVKTDITAAMKEYAGALNASGYYPLTEDLQMFLQVYGDNQGWYISGLSTIDEVNDGTAKTAWLFCCAYVAETEVEPGCTHENLVHQAAVEAGCHYTGNVEHWYCTDCETVWTDAALTKVSNHLSVITPATGDGLLVHMDAVDPACHYEGNVEYWICYTCEQVWTDEALTQLTNIKSVVLPAVGGEIVHVPAVVPGCESEGNIEHWYCADCGQYWQDEALTQLTNVMNVKLPATHQNVKHVDAVKPGCWTEGNVEYWFCADCGAHWLDEAQMKVVGSLSVKLPATHQNVKHVGANTPTCWEEGNVEYWFCQDCGTHWLDEAQMKVVGSLSVNLPATHQNVEHVEEVVPTCDSEGNVEYWYCADCGTHWLDEAQMKVVGSLSVNLPATHQNVKHVEAVEPGCENEGNVEYWYCADCGTHWLNEGQTQITNAMSVKLGITHAIEHVEAKAATCYEEGNIEYWYCTECGYAWTDELLRQVTNLKNVILPITHTIEHVAAVAPTCQSEGNIEYWYCTDCGYAWTDEQLHQVTNLMSVKLGVLEHDTVHFEAVEPGCHYTGNIEYWYCVDCLTFWQNAELTQLTNSKNVILPATGSDNMTVVPAVAPGCETEGNIAHWICNDCGQVWQDAALTQLTNIKNVVLPITHNVIHVEAVAPGCETEGNIEHWYCADCDMVWANEGQTQVTNHKNVILAPTHKVAHVEAVAPGCESEGNIEYWYCTECGAAWQDEAQLQVTNLKNVILPATHNVKHVAAVKPGCETEGNIEYWYCVDCLIAWQNEGQTQVTNLKNVILPPTHENIKHVLAVAPGCYSEGNIEYWYCEDCGIHWQDAANLQITNAKNVILPATHDAVKHVEAVAPTCESEGNIEYWYCLTCLTAWQNEGQTQLTNLKNIILPATHKNVVHVEAVEPGCYTEGNIEHWYCADCDIVWANEGQTQVTNHKNVILPATHQNVKHVAAVAPSCEADGNIEYWHCQDCGTVWQDEAQMQLTNIKRVILPATHKNIVHVEAVEPGCESEGNVEHWYCADCDIVWADEALLQITNHKNVILPATHKNIVHVEAVEPGCESEGNVEHWYCADCNIVWADEALLQITNHKNVILPATHKTIVHVEAVEPGCHYTGNVEHWYCADCNTVWADEALLQITNHLNVIIPATGEGNVVHMEAIEPGCHYEGQIEHWICYECNQVWQDEALTQLTNIKNVVLPELGGEVIHVEAVEPGCHTNGNIEFWYCDECKQVWQDEAMTQLTNIKNVVLPAETELKHFDRVEPTTTEDGVMEHWYCEICDCYFVGDGEGNLINTNVKNIVIPKVSTPVTGDNTSLVVLVALMVISAMGMAVIFTKKRTA